jgi:hypothetical protein
LIKFHLHRIQDTLTADQKSERGSYSRQVLAIRKQWPPMDFEYVITGDESWFYSYNPPDAAWAVSRDKLPEPIK